MLRNTVHTILSAVALVLGTGSWLRTGLAQAGPPVILHVDLENYVQYWDDSDHTKGAGDSMQTTPTVKTFMPNVWLADVVAVNGKPAKGTYIVRTQNLKLNPAAGPGQSMADVVRNGGPSTDALEILQPDGTPVGTIMGQMLVAGSPPPGSPAAMMASNAAIVGGTGAFLGVRGQCGMEAPAIVRNGRNASQTEDPSMRRAFGGGTLRLLLYLIPMSRPDIKSTTNGPAVVHSNDFSLVTAADPAKPGEILSLFATGLGPVRANVDPGQPFPASPLALVNSPVEVTVNGTSAEVLDAVGYPGSVDGYQVNFRVPDGAGHGTAQLQLSAAWITSSAVAIPIQ